MQVTFETIVEEVIENDLLVQLDNVVVLSTGPAGTYIGRTVICFRDNDGYVNYLIAHPWFPLTVTREVK